MQVTIYLTSFYLSSDQFNPAWELFIKQNEHSEKIKPNHLELALRICCAASTSDRKNAQVWFEKARTIIATDPAMTFRSIYNILFLSSVAKQHKFGADCIEKYESTLLEEQSNKSLARLRKSALMISQKIIKEYLKSGDCDDSRQILARIKMAIQKSKQTLDYPQENKISN